MKKNFKRTLAKVMAVALTVSMVGVASTDADAAKKIKLSSKSISVAKGATKKVTIKNVKAKKVKKLTVKSKNKKIATVKKAGKTAFKVTGKKAGKSTKVTVKVKVGKKTTKLTLKVKVTKAKKVVATAAPATTAPTAAPAASASASATPAANASTKPATTPSAKPVATPSATPDEATPAPTEPVQPEPPTTEAKKLPELNLRREAATEWTLGGEYGTAIFNTDDTISYSSYAWAKKAGDCYNNGIAWYIDPAKKGKVDLSAYTDLELTIKTDAEIKFMTWGGSADAASFWDKNDNWGAASKTVENADGSKTITYNLEKIFGSATKVKKAVAVGLTLKSDKDGDDSGFSARTATIYGIKFVNNGGAGTDTNNTDTNNTDTNNVDTNNVDTNNTDKPEPTKAPIPEGLVINVKTSYDAAFSDNDITELEDGNIKLNLSGKNNRVWFKLGEEIDLNDYSAIKVVFANAPQQMTISVFEGSETKGDNWWNNAVANAYPCYGGSASKRSEDGGVAVRGPEVGTIDLTGKTFTSKGGFITVAPNAVTGIASDAVLNEDGDLDFAKNDFTIASIVLVKK